MWQDYPPDEEGEAVALTYRVLGPFEVLRDGAPVDLGPPKQRALLAILLLRAGELVPSDRLVDLLWSGRPPRTAAHSVQVYISALRRGLGGEQIETRTPGYMLHLDGARVDSAELERLWRPGRQPPGRGTTTRPWPASRRGSRSGGASRWPTSPTFRSPSRSSDGWAR